jgi:hypothetical protein
MTYQQKLITLAKELEAQTDAALVNWSLSIEENTDPDGDVIAAYQASIQDQRIDIRCIKKPDGTTDLGLDLFDAENNYVKTIWDSEFNTAKESGFTLLSRIFRMAKDEVSGARDALNTYLKLLGVDPF